MARWNRPRCVTMWNRIDLWVATLAKSVGLLAKNPRSGERGYRISSAGLLVKLPTMKNTGGRVFGGDRFLRWPGANYSSSWTSVR